MTEECKREPGDGLVAVRMKPSDKQRALRQAVEYFVKCGLKVGVITLEGIVDGEEWLADGS